MTSRIEKEPGYRPGSFIGVPDWLVDVWRERRRRNKLPWDALSPATATTISPAAASPRDPIGLAGGLNLYGFANGDPVTYRDPYGLSPDSVKFTGEQAREYWTQLKESAGGAMRLGDAGQRILGSLLSGMMASMERSTTVYAISAIDYPDWSDEAKHGGGLSRCEGTRDVCYVSIDTNKTPGKPGSNVGPLTTLAHEAGGAYLWMTAGVDHDSSHGAVMVENFARGLWGCLPRLGHPDTQTGCAR